MALRDSLLDLKQILIFTDLDGTLLGREDYDVAAALPCIQQLTKKGARLILSSSKTLPELLVWRTRLNLETPFIVENGGAVFFPKNSFSLSDLDPDAVEEERDFYKWSLGPDIEALRETLDKFGNTPLNLIDCTRDQAVSLTGLSAEDAEMAQDRSHTIPLVLNDDESSTISQLARTAGLQLVTGGRFSHLQGRFNKADAMKIVIQVLQKKTKTLFRTIALGDNYNDAEMLGLADVAVVVKCNGKHAVTVSGTETIYTNSVAPEGWREGASAALGILKETI